MENQCNTYASQEVLARVPQPMGNRIPPPGPPLTQTISEKMSRLLGALIEASALIDGIEERLEGPHPPRNSCAEAPTGLRHAVELGSEQALVLVDRLKSCFNSL